MCKVIEMTLDDRKIHVAEIKQQFIPNIIEAARKCDIIDYIFLFGSSTGDRCREDSDIDLAIFGNQTEYAALRSRKYDRFTDQLYQFDDYEQAYDLLYFRSGKKYHEAIMQDIQNGELIYARENNSTTPFHGSGES